MFLGGLLLAGLISGCATTGSSPPGTQTPAAATSPVRAKPRSGGRQRDKLLTEIATCHLLRVGQNTDVAVTDTVVIAAVERYGFSVDAMIRRADRVIGEMEREGAPPFERMYAACENLARLTGVSPALVRFEKSGNLSTTWMRVEGEIDDGFAERVIEELRKSKAVGLVINSPGGSVFEARKLGRYLRANGLRAGVDRVCTSACVDVLAGGSSRFVTRGAKIGIHQSSVPKHLSSHEGGQLYVASSVLYLREMGVDDTIALAAAAVPHNKMLWINPDDALDSGLATQVVARFR